MTTTDAPAALVPAGPVFSEPEQLALAGFLASYTGLTREAYMFDLRQFANWCHERRITLFAARRADIECFARDLEAKGRARSTVSRRLATIAGCYKYAAEEDLLDDSPAAHVRRPRLGYESHAVGLDRDEVGAVLVAAGLGNPAEHALIPLLALNGLREAVGADTEALSVQRGHRILAITRRQESPRTARAAHRTRDRPDRRRTLRGPWPRSHAGDRGNDPGAGEPGWAWAIQIRADP